jgi:F420-dependent oxidoreductase-like protein
MAHSLAAPLTCGVRQMDIGLMVEGQAGLTWERWLRVLKQADGLGYPSLFRSDHYFIGSQRDYLETYVSLAVAARETSRIRFGPLVSPVTFRSPVDVARMAAHIDLLSNGRFVLGLGAGWHEPEHRAYGIPFPPVRERMDRLVEAIHVVRGLWGPGPATFSGRYYTLDQAEVLPNPAAGRPTLLICGRGPRRTLRIVAEFADEWNCVNAADPSYAESVHMLARHCETVGRDPAAIRRSMMNFAIVGRDDRAVNRQAELASQMLGRGQAITPAQMRSAARGRGLLCGRTDEVVEQLAELAAFGVQEVQFQHMDFDDDEFPVYVAEEIAPRVKGL